MAWYMVLPGKVWDGIVCDLAWFGIVYGVG